MTVQFGRKRSEATSSSEFIRGFRDPETRIRVLQDPPDWVMYKRHYNQEIRRFHPCTGDSNCISCQSLDERTQRVTRQFMFNALDAAGVVRVYEVGKRLLGKFENRADKWGTLTTRDVVIQRMGKGLDTEYDIEPGEVFEINLDGFELHDLETVLSEAYNRAVARMSEVREQELSDMDQGLAPEGGTDKANGNGFDPLEASADALKKWLDEHSIEHRKTMSRPALVALVQQAIG